MFCKLLSIPSIQISRSLKGSILLYVLLVTANLIKTILPCAEGQESAACSAGYSQSYQPKCIVC